jgi:glycine hydroxymethyltransferase
MVWNNPQLTRPLTEAVFPVLVATHQVNRVAALAVAAAEFLEYGKEYMQQIVVNSQILGKALEERGIPVVGARRGYSQTHQVIADVKEFGGGMDAAFRLAEANIITNKNLIPGDKPEDWDHPSGLRIGTIEVTRLGMKEKEMGSIAEFIRRVLVEGEDTGIVKRDVVDFRAPYQKIYYCFDNGQPPVN